MPYKNDPCPFSFPTNADPYFSSRYCSEFVCNHFPYLFFHLYKQRLHTRLHTNFHFVRSTLRRRDNDFAVNMFLEFEGGWEFLKIVQGIVTTYGGYDGIRQLNSVSDVDSESDHYGAEFQYLTNESRYHPFRL